MQLQEISKRGEGSTTFASFVLSAEGRDLPVAPSRNSPTLLFLDEKDRPWRLEYLSALDKRRAL